MRYLKANATILPLYHRPQFTLVSNSELSVRKSTYLEGQMGVIAHRVFKPGHLIFIVAGPVVQKRTIYTFPIDLHHHINPATESGEPTLGHFLNHSCQPNARVHIVRTSDNYIEIIARSKIGPGEEVTIDYALMEYTTAARKTPCQCGSARCRGYIMGYKDLPESRKGQYQKEGVVTDYLLTLD